MRYYSYQTPSLSVVIWLTAGQRKEQANSSCVNTMLYLHDKNIQLAPFLTFQLQQENPKISKTRLDVDILKKTLYDDLITLIGWVQQFLFSQLKLSFWPTRCERNGKTQEAPIWHK